uniref:Uncharacterized protein n=1 Tax=Cannabis sativa TaxID=3483 RepID=A0A803PTF3_CANSA
MVKNRTSRTANTPRSTSTHREHQPIRELRVARHCFMQPRPTTQHSSGRPSPYTLLEYGRADPTTLESLVPPRRASQSNPYSNRPFYIGKGITILDIHKCLALVQIQDAGMEDVYQIRRPIGGHQMFRDVA